MPEHIENLSPGVYIAVTGRKQQRTDWMGNAASETFNGVPLKVVSVSWPFVAVEDPDGSVYSIDFREWEFTKLSRHYVKNTLPEFSKPPEEERPKKRKRRRKEIKQIMACSNCGDRMVQRCKRRKLESGIEVSVWHFYCRECGADGGPVETK